MTKLTKVFLFLVLLVGCEPQSKVEKAEEVYQKLRSNPALTNCWGVSAFIRGDLYFVSFDSSNIVFVKDGKVVNSANPVSLDHKKKSKLVASLMEKNNILHLRGNSCSDQVFLELKFVDIVLVKSTKKNYYKQLLKSESHMQTLGKNWYSYQKPYEGG